MGSFFAQSVGFFALTSQLSERHLEPVKRLIDKFRAFTLEAYERFVSCWQGFFYIAATEMRK